MGDKESTGGKTTIPKVYERDHEADEQFELMKSTCPHNGGFSGAVQNVVVSPNAIMVISTNSCLKCGHFFSNQTIIPTGTAPSGITVPKMVMKQ